ncbi:phage/plasmid primase, P4 family [Pseudomonas putida]|jgi:putative DNA primase/helicase|uniref:phage/plasmid primase, P4 family n=1 Tax=Pseudomonas putida TaxID=303 RepID=UPI000CD4063C|nr:phage/plasmid primase, P4 family [Pseudomonas putida]POG00117.1 hypothetical protein BGP83_23575 [Pseudomonas putida]
MDRDEQIGAYLRAGIALVPIPHGKKGPTSAGWNLPANCIRAADDAAHLNDHSNIGMAHAYSDPPTCAVDIDDLDKARHWLAERGIDLDALLAAPDAVRIESGREGRAKLLYRLTEPLSQKKVKMNGADVLDFRCASQDGATVQDVLPPSIHPDTGRPYRLLGDIASIPPIPGTLLAAWHELLNAQPTKSRDAQTSPADLPIRFVELLAGDADLRKRWGGDTEGLKDTSRNGLDMSLTSLLVKRGFNDAEIAKIHHAFPHGKVVQDGREGAYITDMLTKARADRTLSRTEPWNTAHRLIAERFTADDGTRLLRQWNGDCYLWRGGAYRLLDEQDIAARVWSYLGSARHFVSKNKSEPFNVNRAKAGDVLGALKAVAHLDSGTPNPGWMGQAPALLSDPTDLLVLSNGLLHMPSRTLYGHDPRLFTTVALPYAFAPDADEPVAWKRFLDSIWGDDAESIETLQELFGYCLTTDCSQQKIPLVVGPKRSGKGTIARVLRGLIGEANCVGPTLSSLATQFGPEALIGKRLAVFSDVRLSGHIDQKQLADRVLSISGEDTLTIDRKYKPAWTGALKTRLLMFSNELPKILDDSGALSSRFIVLRMRKSFYGKEDTGLADRLLLELPAILNWSLDGLERLKKRGYFRQPVSALELVQELEKLSSPISAFVSDKCVISPTAHVGCDQLYQAYDLYCRYQEGWKSTATNASFGASLRSVLPDLERVRIGTRDNRSWIYRGIGLAARTRSVEEFAAGVAEVVDLEALRAKNRELLL